MNARKQIRMIIKTNVAQVNFANCMVTWHQVLGEKTEKAELLQAEELPADAELLPQQRSEVRVSILKAAAHRGLIPMQSDVEFGSRLTAPDLKVYRTLTHQSPAQYRWWFVVD